MTVTNDRAKLNLGKWFRLAGSIMLFGSMFISIGTVFVEGQRKLNEGGYQHVLNESFSWAGFLDIHGIYMLTALFGLIISIVFREVPVSTINTKGE